MCGSLKPLALKRNYILIFRMDSFQPCIIINGKLARRAPSYSSHFGYELRLKKKNISEENTMQIHISVNSIKNLLGPIANGLNCTHSLNIETHFHVQVI